MSRGSHSRECQGIARTPRLDALAQEREKLLGATIDIGEAPQIDVETALAYRRQTEKVLAQGGPTEQKQIIRTWMSVMKLAPEELEVEITYRLPEPVMHSVVAGAHYVRMHHALSSILVRTWTLPMKGRRRYRD